MQNIQSSLTGSPFTVFFDGACPLCQREISWYRQQEGAHEIEWIDVANHSPGSEARLNELGLSRDLALQRFHIQRADGKLISGGKAFIALWSKLPRFQLVAKVLSLPPLAWLTDRLYDVSLRIRPAMQRIARKRSKCGAATNNCGH